jgi:hypothetical protein
MLRTWGWTIWLLKQLGDSTTQAITTGQVLHADQERVLGPDHPDTLTIRSNLADAHRAAPPTQLC